MRVLIVEDDAMVAETMELLLEQLGYEVIVVSTFEQAKGVIEDDPDLTAVFVDRGLPGSKLGERLLDFTADHRPEVLRILMSGILEPPGSALEHVFLPKPLGKRSILRALEQARHQQTPTQKENTS